MITLDTRFLEVHPATALWWEQRAKCRACANHKVSALGAELCTKMTQHEHAQKWHSRNLARGFDKRRGNIAYLPCIDGRAEGLPCGPDAKLFEAKP